MSDNVTPLYPEEMPEPKKGLFRKIALMVVSVSAVCGILALLLFSDGFNIDNLRRWVKYMNVSGNGTFGSYEFDSHSSNRYASFDNGLAVASVGGLDVYDENGEERFVLQEQLELPQLIVNDNLAMAYDVGGHDLIALHRRNGEVLHLTEKSPILDADMSEDGFICLSSSASGYKSVLSVYNQKQDLVYRWLSSTTYIPLCAVASGGKTLAAMALGQENGTFDSAVYVFNTASEEIQQTFSLGSQLYYDLKFVDNQVLAAIGESSVQFFDLSGEMLGTCSYGDQYLKDFNTDGDGFLTLALNMYRAGNRYSLMTVDSKGNKIAELYLGKEILDLSSSGRYIAVLTPEGLTIYTQNLTVYHETMETGNATSVLMREDGSVLMLGNGQGRLYIP